MPTSGRIFVFGLATVLLAGCQSGVPKTAQVRTPAEIQQAIGSQGYTSWGQDSKGNDFISYTAPNGTMVVKSGDFVDHGTWHFGPNDKVCLKWHKIRNGAETCLSEYINGKDTYYVLPDGKVTSVVTRQAPGNPDHL